MNAFDRHAISAVNARDGTASLKIPIRCARSQASFRARQTHNLGLAWRPYRRLLGASRSALNLRCRSSAEKQLWIETSDKATFTASLEAGGTTFVFQPTNEALASQWQKIAKFRAVHCGEPERRQDDNEAVILAKVTSKEDLSQAESFASCPGTVIMDASDWQIIPAENLVAAFQGQPAALFGVAKSAKDARILLEALEIGTDGVVLRTNDAAEVRQALQYMKETSKLATQQLELSQATVTHVQQLGMGDRVAVDLCSLMVPGEGLLVGSFARGLFLVHSECSESRYINSRPFRINCGPVHSYAAMPGGKTAYLSELKSGAEVLITDSEGRQRVATVGRVKIETRPLVLVEAAVGEDVCSIILQNAETVRLVGPAQAHGSQEAANDIRQAISVTDLQEGDKIFLHRQDGARHTGIAIKETVVER